MVPTKIIAGTTADWTQDQTQDELDNEINATLYDAVFQFRKSGAAVVDMITVTGDANDSDGWDFQYKAPSNLSPGTYFYSCKATLKSDNTVIKTLASGQLPVEGDIANAASFDGRTQAKKDLEAVQTAMRAIISGGAVEEYTIGTRSIRKMKMEDLIVLESKLKFEVVREEKAERIAQGLGNPNNIFVRFNK